MKIRIFLTLISIFLIDPNLLICSDAVLEEPVALDIAPFKDHPHSKRIKTGLTITNLTSYPEYTFLCYYRNVNVYGKESDGFRRFEKDQIPIFLEGDPFTSSSIVAMDVDVAAGHDTSKLIRSSIENGFTEHLPGDSVIEHIEKKFEIVSVRGRELILRPVSEVLTYKDGSIKKFTNPSSQKEEPAASPLSRIWIFAVSALALIIIAVIVMTRKKKNVPGS